MLAGVALASATGCHMLLPDVSHQPVIHNPFPQLSRVAVAPFFNQSDEPTVDGRQFALAYYSELQAVPGFELVPVGVVEEAILDYQIDLSKPSEARRLAHVLGVDAVVIGSVTDYTPYYPPRCGMHVEWYAANPGFHAIPPGYGLPWGTPEEEFIPAPLVFEAEMALARAQLATQTPDCDVRFEPPPAAPPNADELPFDPLRLPAGEGTPEPEASRGRSRTASFAEPPHGEEELPLGDTDQPTESRGAALPASPAHPESTALAATTGVIGRPSPLPPDWPDERGFVPPGPSPLRPPCMPNAGPVMTHTRIYHGADSDFTTALASYYHFRDDARFGGWQTYLARSDDFIRFCCHLHISEMLSARGGAGQTRVVWRWSDGR